MNLHKNPQLTSHSEHKILNISQKKLHRRSISIKYEWFITKGLMQWIPAYFNFIHHSCCHWRTMLSIFLIRPRKTWTKLPRSIHWRIVNVQSDVFKRRILISMFRWIRVGSSSIETIVWHMLWTGTRHWFLDSDLDSVAHTYICKLPHTRVTLMRGRPR